MAYPSAIKMVSVSTTLATNAIAEGKGKRVALFLIGYDPELVASFKLDRQFATPNFYYFNGGHDLHGSEKEPLDLSAIQGKTTIIKNQVDAIAVSSYFSPLNPEHETRAYKAITKICDLPIVLGSQLSTKLGSVERATTAALNASLLAMLQDFIIAVRSAMERRGIKAPLMVVRGDGTLMSDEFAAGTPVETIHSGPAASAIGGRFLSQQEDALIVDVGGTTTDLALIQSGEVTISEQGASVAGYKTSVKAANLLSIGLGGDSHIALDRQNDIIIGPERVVPLSYLAHQHSEIVTHLKALTQKTWPPPSPTSLEYWFLLREPTDKHIIKSDREKKLVKFLKDGPKPVPAILKELDLFHTNQISADELLRQEIIGKAGLTPTDLLHVDGRYTPWDVQASKYGLAMFSNFLGWDAKNLTEFIWSQITKIIVRAIVEFLSERKVLTGLYNKDDIGAWFFQNSLTPTHPHLDTQIHLKYPIIGIGAPAAIMLKDAAKILHTNLILPDYFYVANAVGAIAGSIMVAEEILNLDEALAFAREFSQERALSAALLSGARNPQIIIEETSDGLDTYRIRTQALGNPRLAK
jgi:N-methylhydantoinase A/oxoprolinase/acetone carboxylase beta subunit